jgi:integrase
VSVGLASEWKSTGTGRNGARTLNPLSFHSLRHTAISLLKNAGVSEIVARDIIGHDSEAVSRNYTHVDEDIKRKAVAGLPDLLTPEAAVAGA